MLGVPTFPSAPAAAVHPAGEAEGRRANTPRETSGPGIGETACKQMEELLLLKRGAGVNPPVTFRIQLEQ